MREHFIDSWEDLNQVPKFAEKCHKFDAMRKEICQWDSKSSPRSYFKKPHHFGYNLVKKKVRMRSLIPKRETGKRGIARRRKNGKK